jgi:hypothetical protein
VSAGSVSELGDFHRFVSQKMDDGDSSLSPEQVLDEWRNLHPDPDAVKDEIAAIQEAIDDMENGDVGMVLDDFDRDFRARHNLPTKS